MNRLSSILLVAILCFFLVACGSNEAEQNTQLPDAGVSDSSAGSSATTLDELYNEMLAAVLDKEVGSSERADAIALFAKDAAASQNEDIGNEAVMFIADNWPNYYDSTEMMEKTILCGYFLEYLEYSEGVTDLGTDTAQAVKYVYRGVEGVDDDTTQENLQQVKELLEASGLGYSSSAQ